MSGRHALPSRLGRFYREVAKFGVVGLAGVVTNLVAFNLIERFWGLQPVRASVLATFVSIIGNYLGFRFFTYRDRDGGSRTRELVLFFAFSLIGLVVENSVLYVATYGLGWNGRLQNNIWKFAGVGIATAFRFWSYRTWVFRALAEPVPSPVEGPSVPSPVEGRPGVGRPGEGRRFPAASPAPEPAAAVQTGRVRRRA